MSEKIAAILAASRQTYGSPRVHAELRAQGIRVDRLMRASGLGITAQRRVPRTTNSRDDQPIAPNMLDRNLAAHPPNTVWLADISYVPTGEGWLYLAAT